MKTSLARYPLRLAVAVRAAYAGSALLITSLLSPALSAQYATITFGTPTAISGPSDIVTTGTFHAAIGATATNVTVSGATFATSSPLITVYNAPAVTSAMGSFSSGNANYDSLINRGFFSPGPSGFIPQVEISGLTTGNVYRMQFWTPAWNSDVPTTIFHGPSSDPFHLGNTATAPTYVVGTFTADSSSQYFSFMNGDGVTTTGVMSAVAVYDVTAIPEPSTYAAIAGLGALGLAFWRRRSRRAAAGGTG